MTFAIKGFAIEATLEGGLHVKSRELPKKCSISSKMASKGQNVPEGNKSPPLKKFLGKLPNSSHAFVIRTEPVPIR